MLSQTDRTPRDSPLTYCPIRRALIMAGYLPAPVPQRALRQPVTLTRRTVSPATGRAP